MSDLLRTSPAQRARYSQGAGIYRILPAAVTRPDTLDELRQAIREARRNGWPVTPRGAGSAMDGGNLGEGLLLDLSAFDAGRCEINAALRRARTSPGCTLAALNRAAAKVGLRLPPDPSSANWATLGGMVSTNASGARSLKFGSVRQWVYGLELETVDGPLTLVRGEQPDANHLVVKRFRRDIVPQIQSLREEIIRRYPRVSKNSAGYALDHFLQSGEMIDLVIGAEGTLGVVTDIRWRLDRVPPRRASLRLLVRSRQDLVPAMAALRRFDPTTLEFLDQTFLRVIDPALAGDDAALIPEIGGALLADFEGYEETDVRTRLDAAVAAVKDFVAAATIAESETDIEQLWRIRHGASPALARFDDGRRSLQVIEDGAVPWQRLVEYLEAVHVICAEEGIDVVLFGHAGDGHVHANLLPNLSDPVWPDRVRRVYDRVSTAVIAFGGTVSGEHGAGRLRAGLLERQYGPELSALFRSLRLAFDPDEFFNPGVITPDHWDPLSRLKVGTSTLPLAGEAEAYLRDVELGARWGESRWLPAY